MRIKYLLILAVMIFSCQNIYSEVMSEKEAIGFYSEAFKGRLDKQDYVELRKGKDIIDCRLLMYDRHKPYLVRFYEVENKRMLEFLGTKIRHRKYFEGKDLVDFAVELKEGDWLKIDASIKKIKGMEIKVVEEKWSHKYQLRCIYKGEEFSFEEYDDGQESAFIDFAKQMQKLVIEQFLYGPIIRWAGILYKDEMVAFYPSKKCGYIQMMGLPCDPKIGRAHV